MAWNHLNLQTTSFEAYSLISSSEGISCDLYYVILKFHKCISFLKIRKSIVISSLWQQFTSMSHLSNISVAVSCLEHTQYILMSMIFNTCHCLFFWWKERSIASMNYMLKALVIPRKQSQLVWMKYSKLCLLHRSFLKYYMPDSFLVFLDFICWFGNSFKSLSMLIILEDNYLHYAIPQILSH